jgi:Putative translation factor (SUA5)
MNDDIKAAVEVLQKGGVILYPTDAGWAIGCDACSEMAVKRVSGIEKLSDLYGMVVLMENPSLLERYVDDVPEIAFDLIELAEKPMTIVFDAARGLASNIVGADGSIAIRFTTESFSRELIRRFKKPVVAVPVNFSAESKSLFFSEIDSEIVEAVDYVVKYRQDDTQDAVLPGIIRLGSGGLVKIIRQ